MRTDVDAKDGDCDECGSRPEETRWPNDALGCDENEDDQDKDNEDVVNEME